ncbi:hypothetical protein K402DRAFT_399288, partial [Aulographum hederae CBS 113979]
REACRNVSVTVHSDLVSKLRDIRSRDIRSHDQRSALMASHRARYTVPFLLQLSIPP